MSLGDRVAAVHRQDDSRHKASCRRAEELNGAGDIFRLAPTSQRGPSKDGVATNRIVDQRCGECRFNPAGGPPH